MVPTSFSFPGAAGMWTTFPCLRSLHGSVVTKPSLLPSRTRHQKDDSKFSSNNRVTPRMPDANKKKETGMRFRELTGLRLISSYRLLPRGRERHVESDLA